MLGRFLAAFALGAGCLAFASPAGAGPKVTVTVGGYGQSNAPRTQPTSGQQAGQPSAPIPSVLQAEVTIAQVAAYERYLTYVALVNSSASRPTQAEMAQYFSNGAAATTVPSPDQAGSAYYANGAEATRVPAPAPSAQPPPRAPASSRARRPSRAPRLLPLRSLRSGGSME